MPEVYVVAPTVRAVAVTLDLVPAVDTAANRAAIEQSLGALVLAEQTTGATLLLSEIDAAVATVTTQYTRVAPVAALTCATGEIFALPVVTWV
jgi:uncharacterized phage protein gp47/JayE